MEKGQQPVPTSEPDNFSIVNELSDIESNLRKIINTTRMFGRIAAKGRNEILLIDEIVTETIHLMRDISGQSNVNISFMHLGRLEPRGQALLVLTLDEPLPAKQQQQILDIPEVKSVKLVEL